MPLDPDPPLNSPGYRSTALRHPLHAPVQFYETGGPVPLERRFPACTDLTAAGGHRAAGERIVVAGQVRDGAGRPVPHALVEIWQANAGGRYDHPRDTHDAPLDPYFSGTGRVFTDANGDYRFISIKLARTPGATTPTPGGPITSISACSARGSPTGWSRKCISRRPAPSPRPDRPGGSEFARPRLIAAFDLGLTVPEWALGYRFDIVLGGREGNPARPGSRMSGTTPSQTIGPYCISLRTRPGRT